MTRRERTTVNIPDELKRKARARAILEGRNLSEVIRMFLQAWVDGEIELPPESEPEPEPEPEQEDEV